MRLRVRTTLSNPRSIAEKQSKEQSIAASAADQKAEMRAEEAEMSDKEMRLEGLRVRDANLVNQSELADLADNLLGYSSTQQSRNVAPNERRCSDQSGRL